MTSTAQVAAWRNVSAGPRQVKDFNRAVSALRSEGQARDELYGVIGGKEHRSAVIAMMGPVRSEVTALDDAIRAGYGSQVTSGNVRQIIAAYEAAMPEARKSRPVDDQRRTPEQDAERIAASAAREAGYQAKRDAEAAILAQVMAKAPAGAQALIYAEYDVDASDSQTDYFASHTMRTVAIGWRFSSREDFRALRAAAARFSETAHLGSQEAFTAWLDDDKSWLAGRDIEHRDNYSMGSGNYLSDHGSASSGTGWVVKSAAFPCKWVSVTEDAIPVPVNPNRRAQPDDGPVTVSPSSIGREGIVEVRFDARPADDVIAGLKAHGFRWARGNRCWYGSDADYANALATA